VPAAFRKSCKAKTKFKSVLQNLPNTASTGQKRGGSPLLGGIHTTGFLGLLVFSCQIPLLPVKPAVSPPKFHKGF
jgi:hypothetical protein